PPGESASVARTSIAMLVATTRTKNNVRRQAIGRPPSAPAATAERSRIQSPSGADLTFATQPVPAFRSLSYMAAPSRTNFGKQRALANSMVPVPRFDLKFVNVGAATDAGTSKSAALAASPRSECQIQSSTSPLILLVVFRF